jgi:hypothetical protein
MRLVQNLVTGKKIAFRNKKSAGRIARNQFVNDWWMRPIMSLR